MLTFLLLLLLAFVAGVLVGSQVASVAQTTEVGFQGAVKALVAGDFPFSSGTVIDVDGGFQMRRL